MKYTTLDKVIMIVAILLGPKIAYADAPTTQVQLNAGIPQCLQLYAADGTAFYDCGKYVMKVDNSFAGPAYRYITCNKTPDGLIGVCRYVDN